MLEQLITNFLRNNDAKTIRKAIARRKIRQYLRRFPPFERISDRKFRQTMKEIPKIVGLSGEGMMIDIDYETYKKVRADLLSKREGLWETVKKLDKDYPFYFRRVEKEKTNQMELF